MWRERTRVSAPEDVTGFLREVAFLAGMEEAELAAFAGELEWVAVPGGAMVFAEGEAPDGLYIVRSGRVVIRRGAKVLTELGPPETFGELALLTGKMRTADVLAARDAVLARLPQAGFEHLFATVPAVARTLTRTLARWMSGPRERRVHTPIVTVTDGYPGSPVERVVARLRPALGACGEAVVLDRAAAEGLLGEALPREGLLSDALFARWTSLLDRLEKEADAILLVARSEDRVFRRICARQSDTTLVVVSPPERRVFLTEVASIREETPDAVDERLELVLVRRRSKPGPQQTAAWLRGHGFRAHHHLALDSTEDAGRLVRRVLGRAVGVVLSGGGARGFAHIGALHALRRAGVPIDMLGATSMGGIMAVQFAAGWSEEEMVAQNALLWEKHRPHRALTVPIVALVDGSAARTMLREMFGDIGMEDLPIPTWVTSSNLTRARIEVHETGPARFRLASSMSIPGVGPPVPTPEGDLLVDGGVLDNLPVAEMRSRRVRQIVAINASPRVDPRIRTTYTDIPAWSELLRDRWHGRGRGELAPHPHMVEILTRAVLLQSAARATRLQEQVDLWVEPDAAHFPLLDMRPVAQIANIGRQAVEALAAESGRVVAALCSGGQR